MDAFSFSTKTTRIRHERWIKKLKGKKPGPTVVFFGAVHGNEPAGVLALQEVLDGLLQKEVDLNGDVFGIVGNLPALKIGERFLEEDLNRLWTIPRIEQIKQKPNLSVEEKELLELLNILEKIIKEAEGPLYFIDLHTTSSATYPFITINDALINRKFAIKYPVPMVLGIEEHLTGPMLSYLNEVGYVSIGFEAGQHSDPKSIACAIAFIQLTLIFSGILEITYESEYMKAYQFLKQKAGSMHKVFEIAHLHKIGKENQFKMMAGFISFQSIKKGELLAVQNGTQITAPFSGRIFMPLYQQKGNDGFFIIYSIPTWILGLSALLRNWKVDQLLTFLPGVSWEDKAKLVMRVDLRTARFLAKPFFHLLGYRVRVKEGGYLRVSNRERASKDNLYRKTNWW